MNPATNLPLPTLSQVAECTGTEFLALCDRMKRGEIYISMVQVGRPLIESVRWTWRASYEIVRAAVPAAKEPETLVQPTLI